MSETILQRVQKLEAEVQALKESKVGEKPERDWLDTMIGSFENDPDFDEIVRLGREFRHADRPKDGE